MCTHTPPHDKVLLNFFVRLFRSWWPHGSAFVLRIFFVLGVREAMVMLKSHDFPVKGPDDVGC